MNFKNMNFTVISTFLCVSFLFSGSTINEQQSLKPLLKPISVSADEKEIQNSQIEENLSLYDNTDNYVTIGEDNTLYVKLDSLFATLPDFASEITKSGEKRYINFNTNIFYKFNFELENVKKNDFTFTIKGELLKINEEYYVTAQKLESIINKQIVCDNNEITLNDIDFAYVLWGDNTNTLVSHAGGGIRGTDGTNSKEAIIYNYNKGQRAFEIDLNLTTDGNLVAVHDWAGYSGMKSTQEYKQVKIAGKYTPISIDDILDYMYINKDFYLITDSKSFEYGDQEVKQQFYILVNKALAKDPEILKRIVPQIYNQEMYYIVEDIYKFDSIIYTLYASKDTDKEVCSFVAGKENIKAITMGPVRYENEFHYKLRMLGKEIFLFTLNDSKEIEIYRKKGVHGFYTDFVTADELVK